MLELERFSAMFNSVMQNWMTYYKQYRQLTSPGFPAILNFIVVSPIN
jgi:hypothetical protein